MQEPLSPPRRRRSLPALGALVLVAALVAAAVAGCGGSAGASRPDPKPVKLSSGPSRPVSPRFPGGRPAGAIFVVDLTNNAAVRPATLAFASNGTLTKLQWSGWGGSAADGHGTAVLRVCTPSCVQGHSVSYPVTVHLSSPASCFGAHFYGDSSVVVDMPRGRERLASFIRNPCVSVPG